VRQTPWAQGPAMAVSSSRCGHALVAECGEYRRFRLRRCPVSLICPSPYCSHISTVCVEWVAILTPLSRAHITPHTRIPKDRPNTLYDHLAIDCYWRIVVKTKRAAKEVERFRRHSIAPPQLSILSTCKHFPRISCQASINSPRPRLKCSGNSPT
jgi:hypothetical protein